MAETDKVVVGRVLPKVASVVAVPPTSVTVRWSAGSREGRTEVIDLAPMLLVFKLYKSLRDDPVAFADVHVVAHGSAIAWGDDEAIDLSATALEELADQAMTTADFKAFMERHRLTLDTAAGTLGLSRRLVAYYAAGREIPRTVALACGYLDGVLIGNKTGASPQPPAAGPAGLRPDPTKPKRRILIT